MGMHEREPQMADTFGIPEYFATHIRTEDAGGGCVRIYNCTLRGRILIPLYSVVFPAAFLLPVSKTVQEASQRITLEEFGARH
jgi:hypothetical protein